MTRFSADWVLPISDPPIAGGIVWWIVKHAPEMMFSATLRQMKATAKAEDEADHGDDEDKA